MKQYRYVYNLWGVAVSSEYQTEACVIGAGPYGLSVAAHLRARGVNHRIVGKIMHRWRNQMPKGMYLESEGFASNLSEPSASYTLESHCKKHGLAYGDLGVPVSRDVFVDYAMAFQRKYAPSVEERLVTSLDVAPDGFEVTLEGGEQFFASKAIIAVGMDPFTPPNSSGCQIIFVHMPSITST